MKRSYLFLLSPLLLFATACSKENISGSVTLPVNSSTADVSSSLPIFFEGYFEGLSVTAPTNGKSFFSGTDTRAGYDWNSTGAKGFGRSPYSLSYSINFENTNPADQTAAVVNSPSNPSDATQKVLQFEIVNPAIKDDPSPGGFKGRVQLDCQGLKTPTNAPKVRDYYESVRLYVPTDFNQLLSSSYPLSGNQGYLTLFEFFDDFVNYAPNSNSFRISVNLEKSNGAFYLRAQGQQGASFSTVYTLPTTPAASIPTGSWVTIKMHIVQTNTTNGTLQLSVTRDGGTEQTIVNESNIRVSGALHDGFESFYPAKLYASKSAVEAVRGTPGNLTGKKFRVYWDDLVLRFGQ